MIPWWAIAVGFFLMKPESATWGSHDIETPPGQTGKWRKWTTGPKAGQIYKVDG